MYLGIIIFPILSFITCLLYGRKVGYNGVKIIGPLFIGFSCILSWFIFHDVVINESIIYFNLWNWFNISLFFSNIGLQFDYVVCSMLVLITTISFFVHLFSTSYMDGDAHLPRFMGYLSLFTFFMVILVTSHNLIQLFIGWEGVGLCSYLLINFWYTRLQANKSAIKAMIVNKVGDIGVLLAMILIWIYLGSWQYNSIFCVSSMTEVNNFYFNLSALLFLIGVIGKSAQIGLHTWLPDAMEGPTPVSALIHAATMVTAGVFLIIRLSPLFELTPSILFIVVIFGSLTAFFSSSIGLTQNDLKKVIAYSTCSQLGYMIMICGFSQYDLGLFHLINHGFFKALLFLSAGSIIHALNDEQDFRKMGSMRLVTPLSYACILIGSLSLMGLPFLTGFYSKDLIIEMIYGNHIYSFSLWLGILAASLTAFYSFRLVYSTFFSSFKGSRNTISKSHEGSWNLLLPLIILLFSSLVVGYNLQNFILFDQNPIIIPNFIKFLPLIVSIIGSLIALYLGYYFIIRWGFLKLKFIQKLYAFTNSAWYFDKIISHYFIIPCLKFGLNISYKLIDNQHLEKIGPYGLYNQTSKFSNYSSYVHNGKISFFISLLIFFIMFMFLKI
uniref:NADH-ubiquinone oxidoreductase chain 5 n=1 Tax=Spirocodon saltatrix TaxID=6093 RepID=A0A7D5NLY5_9CNID|nr:NADH dehydrogenase subunit 5 [Spirocodon saltatrix]QLH56858.1 NADH dehydrogenase subunit 5 [Spirocodon saltatrix]